MQLSLQSNQSVCETIPGLRTKVQESFILLLNWFHLRIGRVEGRGDRNLVLSAGRDVECSLPHDGHVQVMNYCNLQTLQGLNIIIICFLASTGAQDVKVAYVFVYAVLCYALISRFEVNGSGNY